MDSSGILFRPSHSGSLFPPEEIIFLSGIVVAFVLCAARYEEIGGNPIPVVIFKNSPTLFHVFLVALNLGFTAAVMTIFLRAKNKSIASICRRSGVVCSVLSVGVVLCAALASSFAVDLRNI